MAVELKQFVKRLTGTMLMSVDEVRAFLDGLPPDEQPRTGKELAEQLVRHKRLTAFQAQAVYDGKGEGLVLGNYVILERIGQGGMGTVYQAQHRQMKRVVAIKVLAPHLAKTPEGLKRFQREVRAAAALNHPHIVTAYDAAESKGARYLVMEYVDGADLSLVVKSTGPLPVSRAVQYVLQVARALEYAHSKGIIHRDIKPSNLLVDRQDNVKILDLGLARIQDPEGLTSTDSSLIELTRTGMVLGTVDYMPPEQTLGAKDIDHRADIYSLGISLYYLLTGRVPYEGSTLLARFLAHREQEIPSLQEWAPEAPDSLERVFRKMVAKEAKDRYATMSEVIADLEACLAQSRASSVPPASPEPDSAWLEVLQAAVSSSRVPAAARAVAAAVIEAPPIAETRQAAVTMSTAQAETRQTSRTKAAEWLVRSLAKPLFTLAWPILVGIGGGVLLVLFIILLFVFSDLGPTSVVVTSAPPPTTSSPAPAAQPKRVASGREAAQPPQAAGLTPAQSPRRESSRPKDKKPAPQPELSAPAGEPRGSPKTESTSPNKPEPSPTPPESTPPPKAAKLAVEPAPAPPAPAAPYKPQELFAALTEFAPEVKIGGDPKSVPKARVLEPLSQAIRTKLEASHNMIDLKPVDQSDKAVMDVVLTLSWAPPYLVLNIEAELKCLIPGEAPVRVWTANSRERGRPEVFRFIPANFDPQTTLTIWEEKVIDFFKPLGKDHREAKWIAEAASFAPSPSSPSSPPQITDSIGMTLVLVPAGEFLMGANLSDTGAFPSEKPQHRVRITRPFYLAIHEVTQAQFRRFVEEAEYTDGATEWSPQLRTQNEDHPIAFVSWIDAFEFCRWLGTKEGATYRLSTEAEWEYACRAGSQAKWCFGDGESKLDAYAWYDANSGHTTHAVMQKKPNAWGLYDMHGNVWEWCRDWDGTYPRDSVTDPLGRTGGSNRVVIRGGGWGIGASGCRASCRYPSKDPFSRDGHLGFRVARNVWGSSATTQANPEPAVKPTRPAPPPAVAKPAVDPKRAATSQESPRPASSPSTPSRPPRITNSIGMKLVLIPAGEFLMGSPESDQDAPRQEKPRHRVRITRPFYLGVTEVTQEQYQAVMGQNPSPKTSVG